MQEQNETNANENKTAAKWKWRKVAANAKMKNEVE